MSELYGLDISPYILIYFACKEIISYNRLHCTDLNDIVRVKYIILDYNQL